MQILKAGVLYFAIVFGAGFVLGPIRILWVVPHFGTRMAELMEAPVMFLIIIVAARWTVRRLAVPYTPLMRLSMGCVSLVLLLIAEFTLVLCLRGISISEYFATRDPVSGTVYYYDARSACDYATSRCPKMRTPELFCFPYRRSLIGTGFFPVADASQDLLESKSLHRRQGIARYLLAPVCFFLYFTLHKTVKMV